MSAAMPANTHTQEMTGNPRLCPSFKGSKSHNSLPRNDKLGEPPKIYTSRRSKINSNLNMVLRALGLGLISNVTRRWLRDYTQEPLKIVLRRNRTIALLRSLIHIIPVSIALWLVTLNWTTYYVGSYTLDQVYYQIGAKALEIMVQTSLAAIVLGYVRHELVLGKGLPFGALFSGLQVNQVSYLWSMEFWGSIGSKSLSIRRKLFLFVFLLVVFILAAGVGPSTAVLVIPRRDYWPAGSTHVWIDGAKDDIWPTQLNGSMVPAICSTSSEAVLSDPCPSSEWQMVLTWVRLLTSSIPKRIRSEAHVAQFPDALVFSGNVSLRPLYSSYTIAHDPSQNDSSASYAVSVFTTQQSIVADTLIHTAAIWVNALDHAQFSSHGVSPGDEQSAVHTISQDYYQPYSVASCVRDSITAQNTVKPIAVPVPPLTVYGPLSANLQNLTYTLNQIPVINYPPITRAQLLDIEGSDTDYRTKWFELSSDYFNVSGLGAAIVLPKQYSNTTDSVETVICNLDAGWGSSSLNTTWTSLGLSSTSSLIDSRSVQDITYTVHRPYGISGDFQSEYMNVVDRAIQYLAPVFPASSITIQENWAELLNPRIPNLNTTVIDYILKMSTGNETVTEPELLAQYALGALLTNGLARVGAAYEFQGNPRLTQGPNGTSVLDGTFWVSGKGDFFTVDSEEAESQNWVKLRVDSTIQGYADNLRGSSPKTAITFLLTYCAMAVAYTVYTGISGALASPARLPISVSSLIVDVGNSSTAWDSISEVTALAMNSTPTKDLQNTCGGISEMRTFKTPVRVVVRKDPGEDGGEHLELVFGDHASGGSNGSDTIKPNRTYGRLPLKEKFGTPCNG